VHQEWIDGERVFVIRGFLTPEESEAHIASSEAAGYGDAPITTAKGFDVALATTLFERARPFLPPRMERRYLLGFNERFRFYRYDVGQAFRLHYDGSFERSTFEASCLTFMVYLNDGFTGGETAFYEHDGTPRVRVAPEQGMALVFEHRQLHEGAPVESGRKYVLRTDVMYGFRL
jgi:hypothetical protein